MPFSPHFESYIYFSHCFNIDECVWMRYRERRRREGEGVNKQVKVCLCERAFFLLSGVSGNVCAICALSISISLDLLSHVIVFAKWENTTQSTWFREKKTLVIFVSLSLSFSLSLFFFTSSFSLVVVFGCCCW